MRNKYLFEDSITTSEEKIKDHCGVVGIASKSSASNYIYYCLRALQHRGQEAAGIAVFNKKIDVHKDLGLVANVFDDEKLKSLKGKTGIGHTYYSIKLSKPENAQPTIIREEVGEVALAHNGILVNAEKLRRRLRRKGHEFVLGCEEEVVAYLLFDHLETTQDLIKAIRKTFGWRKKVHTRKINAAFGINSVIERLNREIKRRIKWFGTFQSLEGATKFIEHWINNYNTEKLT